MTEEDLMKKFYMHLDRLERKSMQQAPNAVKRLELRELIRTCKNLIKILK